MWKYFLQTLTHVAILHVSDIRPQPAVSGSQYCFHALFQLIETHSKTGEIVHLQSKLKRTHGLFWHQVTHTKQVQQNFQEKLLRQTSSPWLPWKRGWGHAKLQVLLEGRDKEK